MDEDLRSFRLLPFCQVCLRLSRELKKLEGEAGMLHEPHPLGDQTNPDHRHEPSLLLAGCFRRKGDQSRSPQDMGITRKPKAQTTVLRCCYLELPAKLP